MEKVTYQYLGLMDYQQAWDYQKELMQAVIQRKLKNRHLSPDHPEFQQQQHYLLFCHHPPVYTLGKSGSSDNLLLNQNQLKQAGVSFYKINRGGDITYHGPGQVVGYPIFDLDLFFTDIHRYVRSLEEVIIRTLADYGIQGGRIKGFTGVWLEGTGGSDPNRKICAIGVHLSRWVTMHGFALNVNTNLKYFNNIIPCGIQDQDKTVTSMQQELGKKIDTEEVMAKLKYHFAQIFGFEFKNSTPTHPTASELGDPNKA